VLFLHLQVTVVLGKSEWEVTYDPIGETFVGDESSAQYITKRRPLEESFDPLQLRVWLQRCQAEHRHPCPEGTESGSSFNSLQSQHRFRAIDVVSGEIVALSKPTPYVATSYVWGRAMSHYSTVTTAAGAETGERRCNCGLLKRISWDNVPRTVREAATVVRDVGEQYPWVDALCIDPSDAEDKRAIIGEMSAIYENAFFTIIAAGGEDAEAGLHRLESRPQTVERPFSFTSGGVYLGLSPSRQPLDTILQRSKWISRAWTYPERLLSPRRVYFTVNDVFFTCGDMHCSEAYALHKCLSTPSG